MLPGRPQTLFVFAVFCASTSVAQVDLRTDRGIFHRIQSGPLTETAAHRHCASLKERDAWCGVVPAAVESVKSQPRAGMMPRADDTPATELLRSDFSVDSLLARDTADVEQWAAGSGAASEPQLRAEETKHVLRPKADRPARISVVEPADDDLLILQMRISNLVLSEVLIAYQTASGVCLYLSEVTKALDFPIDVDLEKGRAEGWFLREDRVFVLDLARQEVLIAGDHAEFDAARIELHRAGICVELTLLSTWFPIKFELDMSNAIVNLISWEPLPIEQRLARARQRKGLRRGEDQMPNYPRVEVPYKLWSWPVIDTFLDYRFAKENEDAGQDTLGRYNVLAVGDFLKMSAELFLSGDSEDAISTARARIGRKDPHGGLLGFLDAREFTLGDVATPQTPLVARNTPGRGIEVSSFPLNQPEEFDRVTLRGTLPLGWEVELYRNGVLLDFRISQDDGRYEFEDVPLLFGRNELRLVFYGPQGQIREKTQNLFIGSDLVKPGEDHFRVAINQQDRDLITVSDDTDNSEAQGKTRFVAQYERGIAEDWSVTGSLFSLPFESGRRNYLALGLRTTFQSFATGLDVAADDKGGVAGELSAQGFLGRVHLFAKHDQFFDFISERAEKSDDDELRSRSLVRADSVLPIGTSLHIPVSIQAKHELRESGRNKLSLSNRISTAYRRLSATNSLQFDRCFGGDEDCDGIATGSLLLNYYLMPVVIRGEMAYDLHPDQEPTNLLLTIDWGIEKDLSTRFTASHNIREELTGLTAGLNKRFGKFALGANLGASNDGTFFAGLSITLSSGRDPWSGSLRASPFPTAAQGTVAARVFVDENRNGRFDDDDSSLADVGFVTNRRKSKVLTNEDGTAVIGGLPVYQDVDVSIARSSLEDPYLVPAVEGFRVPTRPGAVAMLEIPLVRTGEVDGTVFLDRGGETAGIGDVRLELLNEQDEVIQTTQSEFDGFYLFELVPLGRYGVRVLPNQLSRLLLAGAAQQEAVLTNDEPVVSGVDFTIVKSFE